MKTRIQAAYDIEAGDRIVDGGIIKTVSAIFRSKDGNVYVSFYYGYPDNTYSHENEIEFII